MVSRPVAARCALALALALAQGGCTTGGLAGGGGGRLTAGEVLVAHGDGWRAVEAGAAVPDTGRLRTGLTPARLALDGGALWMGPSAIVALDSEAVELERGQVVLHATDGLRGRYATAELSGAGVYRLAAGASPRVGVYEGAIVVRRPAERRAVPALRQLGLGARRLPARPEPLAYALDDDWDRELLPRAIAFDEEAGALARGIDREYGRAPQPPSFYASFAAVTPETVPLLASTAREVTTDGAFGPPSDALITLFVGAAVADAKGAPLEEAVRGVAAQRTRGARWGLVALESGVGPPQLADAVDLARERRDIVAPGPSSPSGPRTPRPGPTGSPRPGHRDPGRPSPPPPSPTPTPTPTPSPTPPEPGGLIRDTVEGILG